MLDIITDVDFLVCEQACDKTLLNLSLVNRHFFEICELLYKHKISKYFVGALEYKPNFCKTNKRYYYILSMVCKSDYQPIELACKKGYLSIVKWLVESLHLVPTEKSANLATCYGRFDVVKYLVSMGIYPSQSGMDLAVRNSHIKTTLYLLELGLRPSIMGIDMAVNYARYKMIRILAEWNLLPDIQGANYAAQYGYKKILRFLISKGIYPNQAGANTACLWGNFDIISFMDKSIGLLPNQIGAKLASLKGHKDIQNFLKDKGINVF